MPPPLNPAILVAYATSTGTTREIAERIASTLEKTTSWRVDCKSVSDLPSLHKQFHIPKTPVATPPAEPATPALRPAAEGEEDHTIHANPLSAVITNPPEPQVEYKAVVIGSAIHTGQWIHSGRNFVAQNKDFLGGRCCAPAHHHATKGGGLINSLAHHHHEESPPAENKQQQQQQSQVFLPPKVFAFSVGMPGPAQDALNSEQASVETYLRKALGKRPIYPLVDGGEKEKEEEEVLERHVLFRGMWSPRQIEILAPRIVTKVLKWCIPKDSKFMKEDDERDWEGIERWVLGAEAAAKENTGV
ncbi:hypothetical protein QBC37DRAFT_148575 [Rhypophila decipiens]|uniref:Flavodoxin-like domain-containing protein n=1 Tax=Rhypophila decipiens TaxID=261697 RepID=A0AAN7B920_9PEZI|nr:hypothetical protein QBC37DRAFT_148575 [Rhypophila decipiens]